MAKTSLVLCDTNILIDVLRGNEGTKQVLEQIGFENICISIITKAELLYGVRDKQEKTQLTRLLTGLTVYQLTDEISNVFDGLMMDYSLSHKIGIPDALIAATAIVNNISLITSNMKDFKFIPEIEFVVSAA